MKRSLRTLSALGSALILVAVGTVPAVAAEVPGFFDSVAVAPVLPTPWQQTDNSTAVPAGSVVDVEFAFTVPDQAAAGDTATLTLPSELSVTDLISFDIVAPDGVIGAVAASGAGDAVIVTLSDYVDSHTSVSGTVRFPARFDSPAATETPTAFPVTFSTDDGTFAATVNGYTITETGFDEFGVVGASFSGESLVWTYRIGAPAFELDFALMDGATTVDCSALQVTYRDAPWDSGDPYPADDGFTAPVPASTATCGAVSGGLEAATQVVSISDEAGVADGVLREFQLTTTITDAARTQFQTVLATTDAAGSAAFYAAGLADRQVSEGTGTGTLIPAPTPTDGPAPKPDGDASGEGELAESGPTDLAAVGLSAILLLTFGGLAMTRRRPTN
ncbi:MULTISPECIES: Ig-like domain-containing protein [unclassified Microbacterium]|uniref:Ig-like domain-containing protein n=1 Tax=unclassified Microbacterium TaxID=2609290 RepID=UPI00109C4F29|nr:MULTISPECIES: Ig-like domain-containing protein [unclassified Microbacterium]